MLRVALTGGVGSGKSTAAAMLQECGVYLFQSDEAGRALMQQGGAAFAAIVQQFGAGVVKADGSLDRPALARIAFDEGRVEELNAIVHPLVIAEQTRWAAEIAAKDPVAVAVVESALVFETKHAASADDPAPWRTRFDRIVVVTAPEELRRWRYIQRVSGLDEAAASADFDRRNAAQWSDERKAAMADFVIANDDSLQELRDEVQTLWEELKTESAERARQAM
ncbi:dephospho-CoA kinase [Terriglobus roseus]|uniref:Dephospho-CoA kinase n=1 Tax=Terriglobus roseus TaxID=392734 RepID=A0A1G7G6T7_9BACT|nr:dephospho-CoA kinase [Terriglobus roseus]SDE83842.1 dephospho-CoA kinase [Terriglobus roseus]